MKLKVFEESKPSEPEKEVYFRLIQQADRISLAATNKEGAVVGCGWLLRIEQKDGRFFFVSEQCVSNEIGAELDEHGCVVIRETP